MKKKSVISLILALSMMTAVCGCGSKKKESVFTGENPDVPEWQANLDLISPAAYAHIDDLNLEPGTYISVIGKTENTSYWKQVKAGVEQAADDINEKLGYSGSDEIKVLFNAPADGEDIDEQVNILDEEMSRYPDVIAIASIDENASSVQFDLASENGIPVVAFDAGNSYQGIQCTCMTDNTKAAAEGASKLCEAIGDSGEVALIVPDSVSGNAKERVTSFQNELSQNHPGVQIVETLYMDKLNDLKRQAAAEQLGVSSEQLQQWTTDASGVDEETGAETDTEDQTEASSITEEAKTKLEDIDSLASKMSDEDTVAYYLEKHPDLKGCFGINDQSVLLGAEALRSMEKTDSVTLMGFDAGKELQEEMEDGTVDGLVVQNPFGMGYATVVAAARTVLQIGNEAVVDTGYTWVDPSNIDDENIQSILYE